MTFAERCIMGLVRLLLPHIDNEHAANYLRSEIGQHDTMIEWAAVRSDTLIDDSEVTLKFIRRQYEARSLTRARPVE